MTHEELQALLEKADEHNNKGNYNEAEKLAQQVLDNSTTSNVDDRDTVKLHCSALITLAKTLWRRADYLQALDHAQKALDFATENKLPALQAKALGSIGLVHQNLSNYPLALDYMGKALALDEELGNKAGVARHLGNIGLVHAHLTHYPLALDYMGKALALDEELGNKAGIATRFGNIGLVHKNLSDYPLALDYMGKALELDEELGNKAGIATRLGSIGSVHMCLSNNLLALEYYGKALALDEELGNKIGVAIHLGNIGTVHKELADSPLALDYYAKALALDEELGNKVGVARHLGNIGIVHDNLSDYTLALGYHGKALALAEELDNKAGEAIHLTNIGAVHAKLSDYSLALEYYQKSLAIAEELGLKNGIAINLCNIGETYATSAFVGNDTGKAEEFLLKASAMNEELGTKGQNITVFKNLSELYAAMERWRESREYFEKYHDLEKEVQSEEAKKQAALMEQRRMIAEREKEIAIAKAAADAKHQATEQLLHNVLPPTIANKMLGGNTLIAERLPSVSVLFADIVNFTKLSQRISAEELVEGLDRIFSSFDTLSEKYGLEKIKTIGDAYMVVSGAPDPREDHAEAMAQFALEMVEAMKEFTSKATGEKIQLRIGIHSGEVVAGVIGKKKFAYDLWGDAVNTASRMESHGEPGRIHVSSDFVEQLSASVIPEQAAIHFIERGEIEIKGKGKMRTYFLEKTQ